LTLNINGNHETNLPVIVEESLQAEVKMTNLGKEDRKRKRDRNANSRESMSSLQTNIKGSEGLLIAVKRNLNAVEYSNSAGEEVKETNFFIIIIYCV